MATNPRVLITFTVFFFWSHISIAADASREESTLYSDSEGDDSASPTGIFPSLLLMLGNFLRTDTVYIFFIQVDSMEYNDGGARGAQFWDRFPCHVHSLYV